MKTAAKENPQHGTYWASILAGGEFFIFRFDTSPAGMNKLYWSVKKTGREFPHFDVSAAVSVLRQARECREFDACRGV